MTITGPSDKGMFRDHPTEWTGYIDPLPACGLGSPTDAIVPSVSTIKKAWPKFLGDWIAGEVAGAAWKHRNALVAMDEREARDLLAPAANRQRDSAADRGHAIHDALERIIDGRPLTIGHDATHDADIYVPCLELLVAELRPEIVATEVVVFGDGYAGTFDAIWRRGNDLVIVDYKSRKAGKAATRYPEEGAQLAAYSRATYWVVEDDDGMRRMAPLEVSRGLIVSIAPDGYRLYDVDLDSAHRTWTALHGFWSEQKAAPAMFSRPTGSNLPTPAPDSDEMSDELKASVFGEFTGTAPATVDVVDASAGAAPPPADGVTSTDAGRAGSSPERVAWMLERIDVLKATPGALQQLAQLWPSKVPKSGPIRFKTMTWTDSHIDQLIAVIDEVEGRFEVPFGPVDPAAPPPEIRQVGQPKAVVVDDTEPRWTVSATEVDQMPAGAEVVEQLRNRLAALPDERIQLVATWAREAHAAGVGFGMGDAELTPMRNFVLATLSVEIAERGVDPTSLPLDADALAASPGIAIGILTAEAAQDLIDQIASANQTATAA